MIVDAAPAAAVQVEEAQAGRLSTSRGRWKRLRRAKALTAIRRWSTLTR